MVMLIYVIWNLVMNLACLHRPTSTAIEVVTVSSIMKAWIKSPAVTQKVAKVIMVDVGYTRNHASS